MADIWCLKADLLWFCFNLFLLCVCFDLRFVFIFYFIFSPPFQLVCLFLFCNLSCIVCMICFVNLFSFFLLFLFCFLYCFVCLICFVTAFIYRPICFFLFCLFVWFVLYLCFHLFLFCFAMFCFVCFALFCVFVIFAFYFLFFCLFNNNINHHLHGHLYIVHCCVITISVVAISHLMQNVNKHTAICMRVIWTSILCSACVWVWVVLSVNKLWIDLNNICIRVCSISDGWHNIQLPICLCNCCSQRQKNLNTHTHTKTLIMLITCNIKFSDNVFYCCLGVACKIYKIVAVNVFNLH